VIDYEAVRALVAKLFAEGIEATVPVTVRETVAAVARCCVANSNTGEGVSLTAIAKELGLDKSPTHHRVRRAIERGYLVNREDKRGMPARIAIADPLPDEIEILPAADALGDCCGVVVSTEGIKREASEEGEPEQAPLLPPNLHRNTTTPPAEGRKSRITQGSESGPSFVTPQNPSQHHNGPLSDQDAVAEELAARGNGKAPPQVCAQCQLGDEPLLHVVAAQGVVRLHKVCRPFWFKEHPQAQGTVIASVQISELIAPSTDTLQ
jgi:hypothetical protein